MDLHMLAENEVHDDLIQAMENVLSLIGHKLRPLFGKTPIKQELAAQPIVMELVGILS